MSIKQNLIIEQGATFNQDSNLADINGNPFDTAGCTVAGSIRKNFASVTSVPLTVSVANSILKISLDANTTMSIVAGRYMYDVILTRSDGSVDRLLEGIATITPAVTHN